jgi:hypothetical protein
MFVKQKNTNVEGGSKLEATYEPLYLHERSLVQEENTDIATSFIQIFILLDEVLKYGDGVKL